MSARTGAYESVSEYIRDLIRRDKTRSEREAFDRLKAELTRAFAAPDDSYHVLSASDVIARNRTRPRRMKPVRVQEAAAVRIDEIHRYTRERWGNAQADAYVRGLFEAFEGIATGAVASRPVRRSLEWTVTSSATRSNSSTGRR